ncbi:hypothetical protein M407DRAFT_30263 [Tulasnella calospora MUT 4182]|uniref:Uncharacterized protein n=1 Tax=Tulasnella calospora MUT 4182 TaxID=1051891 RepID=A0A0C3Q7M0_9AGAM|nr:hypothetical protein M407DRAFT_30263 [Tulasnella calospora MUT 4182]
MFPRLAQSTHATPSTPFSETRIYRLALCVDSFWGWKEIAAGAWHSGSSRYALLHGLRPKDPGGECPSTLSRLSGRRCVSAATGGWKRELSSDISLDAKPSAVLKRRRGPTGSSRFLGYMGPEVGVVHLLVVVPDVD